MPYFKLVERERFRVPKRTEEGYHEFFGSEDFDTLFQELILDKLAMGRIMGALRSRRGGGRRSPPAKLRLDRQKSPGTCDLLAQQGMVKLDGRPGAGRGRCLKPITKK